MSPFHIIRFSVAVCALLTFVAPAALRAQTPLASWDFNEPSGNALGAGSGAFDLALENGATRSAAGQGLTSYPSDRALDLGSGTNARARGGNTAYNVLVGKNTLTYTTWIRLASPRAWNGFSYPSTKILDRGAGSPWSGFTLWARPESEGELRLNLNTDTSNIGTAGLRDSFPLHGGQWTFVAVSINGALNRVRFHIGSAAGNDFRLATEDTTNSLAAPVAFSPQASFTVGDGFNGQIDKVRVYDGELTTEQLRSVYDADLAAATPNYSEGAPIDLVSVRMGNIGAYGVTTKGNTVAGPRLPFGSAHPSPDTDGGSTSGGSEAKGPFGFSQLHVSGSGGDGEYGFFLLTPQKTLKTLPNTVNGHKHGYGGWEVTDQIKGVDRYAITLRNGSTNRFKVEIAPSHHGAKYRITNLATSADTSHLLLDAGWSIPNWVVQTDPTRQRGARAGALSFDPATNTLTGWATYRGGWLGSVPNSPRWDNFSGSETDQTVYFAMRVSSATATRSGYGTFRDDCNVLDGTPGRDRLVVGQRYRFYNTPNSSTWAVQQNDDFANVGGANRTVGAVFKATGTTPTRWASHDGASTVKAVWNNADAATGSPDSLVVGRTYKITAYAAGDNFTNVAQILDGSASVNVTGVTFKATGTTPTTWSNGTVIEESTFDNEVVPGGTSIPSITDGDRFGAYLSYDTPANSELLVDIAVSFKSTAQALGYLEAQLAGKTFDQVAASARSAWENKLNRILVEGGTPAHRRIFYSSLYRTFMMPADRTNDFAEFTADYPLFDDHYATWDTWRTLFPLHVLIDEDYVTKNLQSFINRWDNQHAPGKPLAAYPLADAFVGGKSSRGWAGRQKQGGDGPDFVIQDALVKGVQGLSGAEWQKLLGVLRHSATRDDGNREFMGDDNVSPAITDNLVDPPDFRWENGRSKNGGGMSQMLEYSYNDYGLALAERALGVPANQQTYAARSRYWENYFCNEDLACAKWTDSSANGAGGDDSVYRGFIATRQWSTPNNTWVAWSATQNRNTPPLRTWSGTDLTGTAQSGFYEGNAGMYTYFLPHDVKRLMDLSWKGATQPADFATRRQHFVDRIAAMAGFDLRNKPSNEFTRYLNAGNEPSFLVMRLFTYAGRPDLTSYWVRKHVIDNYNLREFPGDEDSGAMASMFVWSAAGLFPNAGTDLYFLNAPLFNKSTWQLPGGKTLVIDVPARNASYDAMYIQSATLNGVALPRAWLTHAELIGGGTLSLVVGTTPNIWGRSPDQLPPMTRSYADWASLWSNAASPGGDADGDGVSNLVEYALHSNPDSATDNRGLAHLGTMTLNGQPHLTLGFTPSAAAIDVRYEVEKSLDGSTWAAAGTAVTLVRTGSPVLYRETTPGSAPYLRLRVTTLDNTATAVDTPAPENFSTWAVQRFPGVTNPAIAGPAADPDADGVQNLVEYALGTAPGSSGGFQLPSVQVSGSALQLTFLRARSELTYEVLASSDLAAWTVISTNPGAPGAEVTVTDGTNLATTPRRFLRLRVTAP